MCKLSLKSINSDKGYLIKDVNLKKKIICIL